MLPIQFWHVVVGHFVPEGNSVVLLTLTSNQSVVYENHIFKNHFVFNFYNLKFVLFDAKGDDVGIGI